MKKKKTGKVIWTLLAIVTAVVLVVCTVQLVSQIRQLQEQREMNEELAELAKQTPGATLAPEATPNAPPSADESAAPAATPAPVPQEIDFEALKKENSEIFSWITVEGTVIDYPVLCRVGDDEYYHNHNVKGKETIAGAIYIQNGWNSMDWTDANTVIYGHNMRDGSMFKGLHQFEDRAFFDANDTIVIYTPEKKLTYTIFAAYKRDNAHLMHKFDYASEAGRQAFVDEIFSHKSGNFRSGAQVTKDSRVITLSTCVGGEKDSRFVVQAVLTKEEAVLP